VEFTNQLSIRSCFSVSEISQFMSLTAFALPRLRYQHDLM